MRSFNRRSISMKIIQDRRHIGEDNSSTHRYWHLYIQIPEPTALPIRTIFGAVACLSATVPARFVLLHRPQPTSCGRSSLTQCSRYATMHHNVDLAGARIAFMDLPAVFDIETAKTRRWHDDYQARLRGLRPDNPHGAIRRFPIDPRHRWRPFTYTGAGVLRIPTKSFQQEHGVSDSPRRVPSHYRCYRPAMRCPPRFPQHWQRFGPRPVST